MVSGKTTKKIGTLISVGPRGNRQFWLLINIWRGQLEVPEIFLDEDDAKQTYLQEVRDDSSMVRVYQCGVDGRGAEIQEVRDEWYPNIMEE